MSEQGTDLASFDALMKNEEEGVRCELKHPLTGRPLGQWIAVCGPDSTKARAAERWRINQSLRRANGEIAGDEHPEAADAAEHVAMLCTAWDVLVDGEKPVFSTEAAKALFVRFPFIFDQVNVFAGRRRNFTAA